MSLSRQLASIMFTDIVGYTALVDEDEQKALELLRRNRELQRPIIERYNGRWLKEIGDGVLASFSTISDAVYAAGEIQKLCENESDLKLRIGIHVGEVQMVGNDVFGSGVNIASRLEPLAPVGGILVSGAVYKNIHNRKGVNATFVEEKALKGVKEPVKTYEIKVDGNELFQKDEKAQKQDGQGPNRIAVNNKIVYALGVVIVLLLSYLVYNKIGKSEPSNGSGIEALDKSVVVLPFENISNDPKQEYFVDGMMDEVINHLVKVRDLRVVPRSTAMSYQGSDKLNREIAEELGVATILTGGVRKDGNRLRISIQLIDGKTDDHLWVESYDRNFDDVFAVQSDVAKNIVAALQAEMQPEVEIRIESQPTSSLDAYEYYLKGVHMHNKWAMDSKHPAEDFDRAKQLFQEAIRLDSGYADAYAGLADLLDSQINISDPDSTFMRESKIYADIAYKLNPESCHAHHVQGLVFTRRSIWKEALNHRIKAVSLCPGYTYYYDELAHLLHILGFHREALLVREKGLQKDPVNASSLERYGWQKRHVGQFNDAKMALIEARDQDDRVEGLFWLAYYKGEIDVVEDYLADSTFIRFSKELYTPWLMALKGDTTAIQAWDKIKDQVAHLPWPGPSLHLLLARSNKNWTHEDNQWDETDYFKSLLEYQEIHNKCCDPKLEFIYDREVNADQEFIDLIQPLLNDSEYQRLLESFEECRANNRVRFKEELDLIESLLFSDF